VNVPRSKVFDALYNQIAGFIKLNYSNYPGVQKFMTMSKVYRPYEKNISDQQPSFYLTPGDQAGDQDETGWGITRWKLEFYAIIFMSLDPAQQNPTAAEVMLNTLDMIDDALFNNSLPQTLAGQNGGVPLVWNAWIDHAAGKIEIRLPVLSPQGAIVVPISCLTGTQLNGRRTQ
jgi:hypothetical protein